MPESHSDTPAVPGWSRIGEQRFRGVAVRGAAAALLTHVAFLGLFAALQVPLLAWFNLGSIALYGLILRYTRRGRYGLALSVASIEIMTHAWLAVSAIGWASGFQYFLLALAPVAFFHPHWPLVRKLGLITMLAVAYLGMETPVPGMSLVVVPDYLLMLIRAANIAATFGFIAYFSHHYTSVANRAEAELERLASTDPLTGLYNRRRLVEGAELELARHRRAGRELALVLFDIDGFKQINDQYGHGCGDLVLQGVASKLRQLVRGQDLLSRWGGEELLLVLPETDGHAAVLVAEKLRLAIEQLRVKCGPREIGVTVTAGVSHWHTQDGLDTVVGRADRAMLEGKRAGKNRVVLAAVPA